MSQRLVFPDPQAAADVLTFAGRAARLGDTAVRLQAKGGTLVVTTAALAPRSLLDATPTVLAMRMLPVDAELECDLAVAASALSVAPGDPAAVVLPETGLAPAWAGIAPPRGGWAPTGQIVASVLASRAQWGITAVADRLPTDAGDDVVRGIRAEVWGRPDDALHGMPLGAAFAAFALGFIGGDETAPILSSGAWTRITLVRGHVLVRGPVASGLTPVRRTGPA